MQSRAHWSDRSLSSLRATQRGRSWHLIAMILAVAFSLLATGRALAAEIVRFHVVDRGISQPWNKDVLVGQAPPGTLSMLPALGTDPGGKLLLQMPTDSEMINFSEIELANKFAEALLRHVQGAQARGVRDFEITVVQHIGPLGYADTIQNHSPGISIARLWLGVQQSFARALGNSVPRSVPIETTGNRQELVKKFGRAYLMAVDRVLQSQVSAGKHAEVDFWTGSNGTYALTEAHEVIKNFRDRITHVTLIDGRAFVGPTAKFIQALGDRGDEKVTITNTYGDMPGHKWTIALHSAARDLQKQFKGLTVLLLEPLDSDKRDTRRVANLDAIGSDNPAAYPQGGATYDEYDMGVKPLSSHVLWMVRPAARFRVVAMNGDTKRLLGDLSSVDLVRGITSGSITRSSDGRSGQQNADRQQEPADKPPSAIRRQDWPSSQPTPPLNGPGSPPPPPPGASLAVARVPTPDSATRSVDATSTRGIGGVKLAIAELAGDAMPSITALVYDEKSKRLVLMGEHTLNAPRIEEVDLAMALWLVFGPNAGDPQFSLDADDPRDPSGKWLKAVYVPTDLRGRPFGETMFIADFAMKQLAFAVRVTASGTIEARPPPVPGFKSVADFIWDRPEHASKNNQWARFWIVVDEIVVRRVDNALYFERVKIGVRAKLQVPDATSTTGLRDIDTPSDSPQSLWAAQLTARFDEVAEAMPQKFGRLKELAKAMAICKFIKQQGIRVDLSWAAAKLNSHAVPATDKITAVTAEWKREQERPFTDGHRRGIEKTTRTMHLFGGADLTVNPKYVPDDGRAASASRALSAALSHDRAAPVFSLRVGEQKFYAKVLPITESGQLVWREHARALASVTR